MRILVIVNPVAGDQRAYRLLPKIKKWLSESPHEFFFSIPGSPKEIDSQIINATAQGMHAILLCGGDGTVHKALPAIAKTNIPFGLLPCGRGNDLARNIGLSAKLRKNCRLPSHPFFHKYDLPTINHIPFASIAYVGFDAEVNKLANDGKGYWGGKIGYIVCVLKALIKFRPFDIEITIDRQSWRERVMMVAMANGSYYGGGMKIAPEAMMDDGLLNVCIVKELSKWELLREFPKVFKGTHISNPNFIMKSGQTVKIVSDEDRAIYADGEYVGSLPAECVTGEQSIQIMFPR